MLAGKYAAQPAHGDMSDILPCSFHGISSQQQLTSGRHCSSLDASKDAAITRICCVYVAGVAFSKNVSSSTDNIGYIIPYAIVEHFLSEYMARGSYQGICSPGFYTQPMENPAQQQYLKVPEGASGCVVVKLEPSTEAATHLQLADVILEIEGVPIAADETVQFRDDERVEYSHLISLKHVGDNLKLKILRDGQVCCRCV